jgi:hypothetical protein
MRARDFEGVAYASAGLILSFLFFRPGGFGQAVYGVDVSFLLLPSVSSLSLCLAAELVRALLGGTLVRLVRGSLYVGAVGAFFYFLLPRPAALPVLLLTASCVGYVWARHFTQRLPVMRAVARSCALPLFGYLAATLADALLPRIAYLRGVPLAPAIFWGSVLSACVSALSVLSHSRNPYVSVAGGWLGRRVGSSLLLGALLYLYLNWLRLPASLLLGSWLPYTEWGLLCLSASVGFALLRGAAKRASAPLSYMDLAKHLQVVEVKEDRRAKEVEELVRGFVEEGSKAGLLVHLVSSASAAGVPPHHLADAIRELADYSDPPMPGLAPRWEVERIERENRERRRRLIERTAEEIVKI